MNIQETVNDVLEKAITYRYDKNVIENYKFIKSELTRGKFKECSDKDATKIIVNLIRKQTELLDLFKSSPEKSSEIKDFISCLGGFLSEDVLNQINMTEDLLNKWIKTNIDWSTVKNNMQAIGMVKKGLPYVDGNLIKKVLENSL